MGEMGGLCGMPTRAHAGDRVMSTDEMAQGDGGVIAVIAGRAGRGYGDS